MHATTPAIKTAIRRKPAPTAAPGSATPRPRKPRTARPLDLAAFAHDEALLDARAVQALVACGRTTLWRRVGSGDFPEPIRMGTRCTRWRAADVRAWLERAGKAG